MSLLGPGGQPLNPNQAAPLVDPTGRPIGADPGSSTPMNGLRWGVTFLILDGDVLGVLLLEPDDVELIDVMVPGDPVPQMWVGVRGKPKPDGEHRFVNGWGKMPGMAAALLAAKMSDDLANMPTDQTPPEPKAGPDPT